MRNLCGNAERNNAVTDNDYVGMDFPDEIATHECGHWPHWLLVDPADQGSNWHLAAFYNAGGTWLSDGTYEAVGPHFQSNPYALTYDCLEKHGKRIVKDAPRTFDGLREYLRTHNIEGLVFWKDGEPQCKIKRSDFGFMWPDKTLRVEF